MFGRLKHTPRIIRNPIRGRVTRLEIRVPMSPTRSFFNQARFFNFCLRRLGGIYRDARLLLVVGDNCDIEAVRAANLWSARDNIEWRAVPSPIFDLHGIHGTADFRYLPETDADLVVLSDADTIFVRELDPLLHEVDPRRAQLFGHMAHVPPRAPAEGFRATAPGNASFWTLLFREFDIAFPAELHRYSRDPHDSFPLVPAYFNMGFVALTARALRLFGNEIYEIEERLLRCFPTFMRCQVACTLIAYRHDIDIRLLSAEYNAANDLIHMSCNGLKPEDARVIHYLRTEEIDRSRIVLPENFATELNRKLENPLNVIVQNRLREYAASRQDLSRLSCGGQ